MDDDSARSGGTTSPPYFPPPRTNAAATTPYRAPAEPATPSRQVRAVQRAPHEAPAPLPPLRIADHELRAEIVRASAERGGGRLSGRGWFSGLLLAHPKWFGAATFVLGLVLLGVGIARHHVTNGPAAIVIGLGWIACERVPLTRPMLRLAAIVAVMVGGIFFEAALTSRV
jgi:hypothetical protein